MELAKGYIGVHIDDVNLSMTVGDGSGNAVRPIDPRTGQPMTDVAWKGYMADFLEEIRRQLPDALISHNPVWSEPESDPYVQREVAAADTIELERGFSDGGLTQGNGTYGFETFLAHIDWLHRQGKAIVLQPYNLDTAAKREFEVASYFLIQQGDDAITSDDRAYPDNWWKGWATDIGSPKGERYNWHGLLRRDFADGFVLVNEPGAETKQVDLGGTFENLAGGKIGSLTIPAGRGFVVRGSSDRSLRERRLDHPQGPDVDQDRCRSQARSCDPPDPHPRQRTLDSQGQGSAEADEARSEPPSFPPWPPPTLACGTKLPDPRQRPGRLTQTFRHLRPGRYRVRAIFTGAKDKRPSRSRSLNVRVG